jgi:hypothetical protein
MVWKLKNMDNETQTNYDVKYGEKQWKTWKIGNAKYKTWSMASTLTNKENVKLT